MPLSILLAETKAHLLFAITTAKQGQAENAGPQWRRAESLQPAKTSLQSPAFNWALYLLCFHFLCSYILDFIVKNEREEKKKKKKEYSKISYWETSLEGNWNELWRSHQLPSPLKKAPKKWGGGDGGGEKSVFFLQLNPTQSLYSFRDQKHCWAMPAEQAGLTGALQQSNLSPREATCWTAAAAEWDPVDTVPAALMGRRLSTEAGDKHTCLVWQRVEFADCTSQGDLKREPWCHQPEGCPAPQVDGRNRCGSLPKPPFSSHHGTLPWLGETTTPQGNWSPEVLTPKIQIQPPWNTSSTHSSCVNCTSRLPPT